MKVLAIGRRLSGAVLICMLFAACANLTPHQLTPSVGTTEVTKIIEAAAGTHRWEAQTVLVMLYSGPGFTSYPYAWSRMPTLVIYADGHVLVTHNDHGSQTWTRSIQEAYLPPVKICGILAQIDSNGFFDFNPGDYQEPQITDHGTTSIAVDAWRSKSVDAYALEYALHPFTETGSGVKVPAALANTYNFLDQYEPPDLTPYKPDQIAVLITTGDNNLAAPLWPLTTPSLKDMASGLKKNQGEVLLKGQEAAEVYALFGGEPIKIFTEGDKVYQLAIRPLLPLEIWESDNSWGRLPQFEDGPKTELLCGGKVDATQSVSPTAPMTASPASPTSLDKSAPLQYVTAFGRHNAPGQLDFASAITVNSQDQIVVADSGNDRLQWFSLDGGLLKALTLAESYPHDLSYLPDGKLVVADWWQNEVEIRSINGELLDVITDWPPPEKGYVNPTDDINFAALGPGGLLYLAESRGTRVVILDLDGNLREVWKGTNQEPLGDITDLETDSHGNLYIASDAQNRIIKRSPDGQVQEFDADSPDCIAPLPDGSFYVSNWQKLAYYDATGKLISRWENVRGSMIQDLAVASDGSVIVLDDTYSNERETVLHRYSSDGKLFASFGTSQLQPGQFGSHVAFSVSPVGDVWLMDRGDPFSDGLPKKRLVHLDSQSQHLNTFETLDGMAFVCDHYSLVALSDQTVFVADPCQGTIMRVDANGKLLDHWGQRGTGSGQFNRIVDMTLAPDGQSLYVVDSGSHRITQFRVDGRILQEWKSDDLGVKTPISIAVDPQGTFFLLDAATQQIVVHPIQGAALSWSLPDPGDGVNRIAVDAQRHRIYVGGTDIYLYVFDWNGNYLGRTAVSDSRGVMVNVGTDGRVYRSTGYNKIQVYEPTD